MTVDLSKIGCTAIVAVACGSAAAETLVGSNIDNRLLLAFAVPAPAVQEMMPDGWKAIGFPSGAIAGANLLLALNDKLLVLDAEGKPADPAQMREAALLALGHNGEGARLFALRVYASDPGYDPFGNAVASAVEREGQVGGPAAGGRSVEEVWTVSPDGGGGLAVTLTYTAGAGNWVSEGARLFSNVDPDQSLIFRYERIVDLVMSDPLGKPLAGSVTVTADIPELDGMFESGAEPLAIMAFPVYVREVFEP